LGLGSRTSTPGLYESGWWSGASINRHRVQDRLGDIQFREPVARHLDLSLGTEGVPPGQDGPLDWDQDIAHLSQKQKRGRAAALPIQFTPTLTLLRLGSVPIACILRSEPHNREILARLATLEAKNNKIFQKYLLI
jgi:hypothetical protein